jgi:hypothetical protein
MHCVYSRRTATDQLNLQSAPLSVRKEPQTLIEVLVHEAKHLVKRIRALVLGALVVAGHQLAGFKTV